MIFTYNKFINKRKRDKIFYLLLYSKSPSSVLKQTGGSFYE
ncbi:hypothetical protein B4123_1880 [Bacillus paralicheniformis]|uniref:Uncharacterized protein n=1 Tax=Bacillus paralicheniformis TaxID=1648923 RepID=A0ABY3FWN6_9BACI|nr:hypothetical protein B4123_1880 [Bacillus paralicheniformis]TWJ49537.1 hypothetical protein CHCC5023_1720 [Bacillus paralicheniformis]TWJ77491.1 hypothetical protein CHCC5019_2967 [Bacillus paralicheniformis]TWK49388.1 hypothetical protein CHCC20347_1671 [Bacillus paralicheniformis]TWL39365.1 hypothetical protein CHCC15381_2883 [Bacillus paralicheniformis]